LRKHVLLLTGKPGVGKTTVLMKAVSALKEKGYRVGGIISREVREGETRMGFEILDLSSGRRGWLARMNKGHGPQVGKYRVNIKNLDAIGADAIADALEICDIIAIDEIGPMELFSEGFKQATRKALESRKPVLAVVHWKARDRLINEAKNRDDSEIFTVTYENRDKLPEAIVEKTITSYQLKKAHSDLNQAF
jgi:nucleoside-triphosphatase